MVLPPRTESVDVLEDVRVLGALPSSWGGQPRDQLALALQLAQLVGVSIDGGLGGGEGDTLGDDDGLHGFNLLLTIPDFPRARRALLTILILPETAQEIN